MSIDRRWRVVAVSASLLLNVFLVGLVAGHFWARRTPPAPRHVERPLVPQPNVQGLPVDQRKLFRATIESHRPTIRAARMEQRRLKLVAEADIAAPTFDAAKVTADLAALREAVMAVQVEANAALVDALGKMSPETRAALVNGEFREPSSNPK